jgi:hypothetical protein
VITQEQLKELLHYCPETGVWTWAISRGTKSKDSIAGGVTTISGKKYIRIKIFGRLFYAHRLAFLYLNGVLPSNNVDHEDGNGLNNSWENLRDTTFIDNQKNKRRPANNTSGTAGVCWYKNSKKWQAFITVNRKQMKLGYFSKKEDAIAARKKAESEFGFHPNHGTDRPL